MSHKGHLQKLITDSERRLQKLKEQKALIGIRTPPEVLIEIEDIEANIEQWKRELADLTRQNDEEMAVTTDQSKRIEADIGPSRLSASQGKDISSSTIDRFSNQEALFDLTITAPDGIQFETEVPATILVDQLTWAFLSQWQPSSRQGGPCRFILSRDAPDTIIFNPSETLAEAGISDQDKLVLIREPLAPDSAVRLNVENAQGERFTTVVLLNTPIRQLAEVFLHGTPGDAIEVALIGVPSRLAAPQQLNLDASLYEEGIGDEAILRISSRN